MSNPSVKFCLFRVSLLLVAGWLLIALPVSASEWNLARLMQTQKEQGARQTRFIETRTLAILDQPIEQRGILRFEPPDRLIRSLDPPSDLRAEIDGNRLTLWQGQSLKQTLLLDNVPELLAFSASFRAILGGDLETLQRYFQINLEGVEQAWVMKLTPRHEGLAARIEQITIEGHSGVILRYTTLETGGDLTLTRLQPPGSQAGPD
ncbi:MAG: LolA-related protein [Candidatus Thiodiazotropha sp.]